MSKIHVIICAISILVMIIVGTILFSYPDIIKLSNEVVTTSLDRFIINIAITAFCGGSIYSIFYGIPHEYKVVNQKNNK